MNNKFVFEIKNLKLLYENLEKQDCNCNRATYKFEKSSNFVFPISDFSVNIEKTLQGNFSLLAIIKKDIYADIIYQNPTFELPVEAIKKKYKFLENDKCISILDETNTERLFIRVIENFGIYFFTGRPDLNPNSSLCSMMDNNFDGFLSTLEILKEILEITINYIYKDIYLLESIKVTIEPVEPEVKILKNTKETILPGALKRFYDKIGVSYQPELKQ